MTLYEKISRRAGLCLAVVVAVLTLGVSMRAVQVFSVPNALFIGYVLGPGGNGAVVSVPTSQPTLVMCVCNTAGFRGVGFVTMQHIFGQFLEWVGLESTAGAALTQGFSGATGAHIVFCDFAHQVDIEVNTPDTIRVHNGAGANRDGNVKLIW